MLKVLKLCHQKIKMRRKEGKTYSIYVETKNRILVKGRNNNFGTKNLVETRNLRVGSKKTIKK